MKKTDFQVRIPEETSNLVIQEEFFWISQDGIERKLKLHDYPEIYRVPHLYEYLMDKLKATSHDVLASLLIDKFTQAGRSIEDLVVLEVGAGSGMAGKALAERGVKSIVGIDIVPEAAIAAAREYPGVYENYYVEDLSKLSSDTEKALSNRGFNCILCGSALGFNHIPPQTWGKAYSMISRNSLVAFNVQKERWEDKSEKSFSAYHPWVDDTSVFKIALTHNYQHRFYMDGRSLNYVAVIGSKQADIS